MKIEIELDLILEAIASLRNPNVTPKDTANRLSSIVMDAVTKDDNDVDK